MKRHYIFSVKLDNESEFYAKVTAKNVQQFRDWIDSVSGVVEWYEQSSTNRISPFTRAHTKLAEVRVDKKFTQQMMADALGVPVQQYQYWEYGKFKPKTTTLMKIGEILDIDWTTLIE